MPKPKYIISEFEKDLLIHELSLKTGIIIKTKRDCKQLSLLISEKDRFLSESTIYRLFIHNNQNYTPYMHTLDVLSEYCDYADWADFIQKNEPRRSLIHLVGKNHSENQVKSFLTCSIIQNDYKILKNYLLQFNYEVSDKDCHIVGNDAFKALLEHPKSCKKFYNELCGVPIIRRSFFELLADPDFELNDYHIGLELYLKQTLNSSSEKEIQDKIFAMSLLSRNAFMNGKKRDFLKNIQGLKKLKDEVILEGDHIATFPKARCLMYMILYFNGFKSENDQLNYENWLLDLLSNEKSSFTYEDSKIWSHTILDIYPYLIQKDQFKTIVGAICKDFEKLYPKIIWKNERDLHFDKVFQYTNPNASAHWKKIWKSHNASA